MSYPNHPGKEAFPAVWTPSIFLDSARKAGWDPGPVPSAAIITWHGLVVRRIEEMGDQFHINPNLGSPSGRFFQTTSDRLGVSYQGIGGPQAAAIIENLAFLGCKQFVAVGTAGGVQPRLRAGQVIVVDGALKDDGVSQHYPGTGRFATPSADLTRELKAELDRNGIAFIDGPTWSVATGYRTTAPEYQGYASEGILCTEMEAAAIFAAATYAGVSAAAVVVLDGVFDGEKVRMDFGPMADMLPRVFNSVVQLLDR